MYCSKLQWYALVILMLVLAGCGESTEPEVVDNRPRVQPECSAPSDCGADSECLRYDCAEGTCQANPLPIGTVCGSEGTGLCDAAGVCALPPRKVQGAACGADSECDTAFCVDGVCCDAACEGPCERCNMTGSLGSCSPVSLGAAGAPECTPYVCDGLSGQCPDRCEDDDGCVPTGYCDVEQNRCVEWLLSNGEACSTGTACASGHCVDGLCCNSVCSGACESCLGNAPGATDGICTPVTAEVACRPSLGACDPTEFCDGLSGACPLDALHDSATVCRPADGADCDVPEVCSGDSADCPEDAYAGAGTECRAATGLCDLPEVCSGLSSDCPEDAFAASGTGCRAAVGLCDVAEVCSGSAASCPADSFAAAGTTCRAAAGMCDVPEACAGTNAACPTDAFADSDVECRASAGVCDVAEMCTGDTATCPENTLASNGTECRAAAGVCDLAEYCSGETSACPADVFVASGSECRPQNGGCDLAESCSGAGAKCPPDSFMPAGALGAPACSSGVLCSGASGFCSTSCIATADCAAEFVCVFGECLEEQVLTLTVSEFVIPENGSVEAVIQVVVPLPAAHDIEVAFTVSGSAGGADFTLSASQVIITAGSTSASVTLLPTQDTLQEGDETVVLTIATTTPGVLLDSMTSQTVTITDDDAPALDSIDWLSQDVVVGNPSADPYCLPAERQEAHISLPLGYLRTDAAGDEGGISAQAPAYNSERQKWENRILTTFDFKPYAESQPGIGGIPNGADVFEGEGQYVSIVGTNDSGGVAGWASSWGDGCQFFDGWISYDRYNIPDFDPNDGGSWALKSSPIEGVSNPKRNGCPDGFGSTLTRWTYVSAFEFAADSTCAGETGRKYMDTIVSDHDGGNHHEVFYFTDEYGGKSRWERWECGIPYPDHDYITARCKYNESQSVMHMAYGVDGDRRKMVNANGATCYMTDCRDFTTVKAIPEPGYKPAAWHYGAVIYFSGNILRNGDFNNGTAEWNALNTTASLETLSDGNHYLQISTDTVGWHSVFNSSISEFNQLFDAGGEEAYLPKYLHWGARIRHTGGSGSAYLAMVEWGNPGGEIIDEKQINPGAEWQWVEFHRLLGAATNSLDIRFKLAEMTNLDIDDVYIYISQDPVH